jgi:hypothetical protein
MKKSGPYIASANAGMGLFIYNCLKNKPIPPFMGPPGRLEEIDGRN